MNMRMGKALTLIPSLLLFAGTAAFADAVVTPSPGPVGPGQQFRVAIDITGPTVKGVASGAADVYAFQLSVSYPSSMVQARRVANGSFLSGAGTVYFSPGAIDNGSGTITNIFGTLVTAPGGASGSGTLVNITFQALAAGTPQITISNLTLLDSSLNPIVIDDTPGQVTTTVSITTAEMQKPGWSTPAFLAEEAAGVLDWTAGEETELAGGFVRRGSAGVEAPGLKPDF